MLYSSRVSNYINVNYIPLYRACLKKKCAPFKTEIRCGQGNNGQTKGNQLCELSPLFSADNDFDWT